MALPAALGMFQSAAQQSMTARAIQRVPVDWQVEQQPGAQLKGPLPGVSRQVDFASVAGLQSQANGQTLTTGGARALGIPADYAATFPGQLRLLAGTPTGPLLAQQTAANLHAVPGTVVTVHRPPLPDAQVTITGVVELPTADSLFQKVGAPAGAQPSAPPDNVLLLPAADWHRLFDALPADQVRTQFHLRIDHRLPADPAAAYTRVAGAARNLEVGLAGAGLVGDNLGAALDAARQDARYAELLFLFLGTPGIVLAVLVTALVARSGQVRRAAEQALLRARGATRTTFVRLALAETLLIAVIGAPVGLALAAVTGLTVYSSARLTGPALAATALTLLVSCAVVLLPALRPVAAARRRETPAWSRYGLDLWLIAGSLLVFWITSKTGYQLVLVPEGVPQLSVDYWAFAAPALLWAGASLLILRLARLLLGPGRPLVARLVRPLAAGLSPAVAATLARQRGALGRTATMAALAVAFAVSTSVFDATYQQQAQVDAQLTNGGDVTIGQTTATEKQLAAVPGIAAAEPLRHGFAYVGADLQDLYGVRPSTIVGATRLQDGYFSGGTAQEIIGRLASSPDALLVSQETVTDFQLRLGDQVRLRTTDGKTVAFHYAGVVTEFPTAPRDSFLVANASYLAAQAAPGDTTYLISTDGTAPHVVADRLLARFGPSAKVSDVESVRRVIGSSLTSVDLDGLTAIELAYALGLAVAATGLLLVLGFTERRRTYALTQVLGASARQLASFIWAEVALVGVLAIAAGAGAGWALARMLVLVLSGVFDPPPSSAAVPWAYLGQVIALGAAALLGAGLLAIRAARRPPLTVLRDL
ncbi:hypothetical protein GCM10009555_016460 [Acrocarpospora macrocephala]|uniref:ABC3 transporter permease C-terminal domain-containing protein n=1 Tax=Acrocarpospora macrocephala TaxID=150177 RepID=A0A5M3WES9_9ACTN|nr:hypothetical protein Amac_009010 [Acrocarpospora macrocephala]